MPPDVTPPHGGFGALDIGAVALYMLATAAIALVCARKQGSTDEFFLGGRRMPWFAVGLSIMATLMSTISYLAVPGEMIQHGIAMFAGTMAMPFIVLVIFFLWIPFFMRLRLTSAYEYLEQRFGPGARLLAATLFILLRLGWLGVIIYTCSMAVDKMFSLPPLSLPGIGTIEPLVCWIVMIGVFTTAYTSVGGIRAVIWTDVMQSVVMFAGAIITLGYVWIATGDGPIAWWHAAGVAHAEHTRPALFSVDLTVRVTILTAVLHTFCWTVCTHGSDQMIVQRYFSTTSLTSARRSYLISAISDVLVGCLLALSGLALLAFYLQYPKYLPDDLAPMVTADKWFPYFIAHQLPPGLGGLILAALFAAGMSSISSGINSVSAVGITDILSRATRDAGRWTSGLARARLLSLAIGVVATSLAFGFARLAEPPSEREWRHEEEVVLEQSGTNVEEPPDVKVAQHGRNIMELMAKGFNMFLGPLAGLFFIGMFIPRATSRSAIPAVIGGLVISIVWSYWRELGLHTLFDAGQAAWLHSEFAQSLGFNKLFSDKGDAVPAFTLAIALPCAVTLTFAASLSFIFERGGPHKGLDWTWRAVMKRPVPKATDQA